MKLTPLCKTGEFKHDELKSALAAGHEIGPVTLSDRFIFVKKKFTQYYIAYEDAEKIFRRVRTVHANVCCDGGDFEIEYLVIQKDGVELLETTLPGKKAAQALIEELKEKAPGLDTAAPARAAQPAEPPKSEAVGENA